LFCETKEENIKKKRRERIRFRTKCFRSFIRKVLP